MSKCYTNQCPHCLVPYVAARGVLPEHPACAVAVCESCGHLVAVGKAELTGDIEAGTVPRDWFLKHFNEEDRAECRKCQEEAHHNLGQWG